MTIVKPEIYDRFRCLAGLCPDSCCHEWEVDIDEETAKKYLALPSELGDRLRQVVVCEDGAYRMRIEDSAAPCGGKMAFAASRRNWDTMLCAGPAGISHGCNTIMRIL